MAMHHVRQLADLHFRRSQHPGFQLLDPGREAWEQGCQDQSDQKMDGWEPYWCDRKLVVGFSRRRTKAISAARVGLSRQQD